MRLLKVRAPLIGIPLKFPKLIVPVLYQMWVSRRFYRQILLRWLFFFFFFRDFINFFPSTHDDKAKWRAEIAKMIIKYFIIFFDRVKKGGRLCVLYIYTIQRSRYLPGLMIFSFYIYTYNVLLCRIPVYTQIFWYV